MANTGVKGIDVRQTGTAIVFRASLKDASNAVVSSGTTTLQLLELQSDGTFKSYDFSSNTFKTTSMTSGGQTASMTHRTGLTYSGGDASYNTGIWTYALATLSGFTVGSVYIAIVTNSGASPAQQEREFQYGSDQGDLVTTSVSTGTANLNSDTKAVNGTTQTAGDIYGYLQTNIGALGANLSAIPKTGYKLASDGLSAISAWTVSITGDITGNISGSVGSISSFGTLVSDIATAVWGAVTRTLTSGVNIVLAKGTGITGLNDLSSAQVTSAVDASTTATDAASAASNAYTAAGQTTGASIRGAVGLGAADLDTQLNSIYGVAGDTKSQTDKLQFDGSNYVKSVPQSDPPGIAGIPEAVRDIDNTDPAANSLGSYIKSIVVNGVPVTSTNSLVQTQVSSAVWAKDTSTITTAGSIGKRLLDLFSGITSAAQWCGMLFGKQTGDSTALTEIRATGAGSGGFSPTTDSLEAIRDRGDVAWITGSGGLSGALSVPVHVVDDSNVDVAGKVVTVRDQNGVFIGLSDATDSSGNTVLALDAGTYQLVIAANGSYSGYSQTHVISDETEIPIELVKSAREPSAVGLSTGYLTALVNGVATPDVEFTRQILFLPSGTGLSESAAPVTARSNIAGLVQFTNHIPDATYIMKRGTGGWVEYVANNSDFELPRVLSEG